MLPASHPLHCAVRLFLRRSRRKFALLSSVVLALVAAWPVMCPPPALALPAGGQVVAGNVTTTINGAQLTLDQASRAVIMNWSSFNIAPNERVRILQSGADAALLARVTGGNPTELLGSLKADGKLFLINPRGILVGQGAVIDTAAFLASTLDVADADFLKNGPLTFKGDSDAGVVNLGTITAREGNVLLLAHTVKNTGAIAAPKGTAGLGAGTEVWLASPDAPAFVIKANLSSTGAKEGVDNSGVIAAAQAQLEAAGGSLFDLAVNHSGTISAAGAEQRPDGRVFLTAAGGNVSVTGSVSGGEILVGGDYQGGNPDVANAVRTYVGPDATFAAARRAIVWADEATHFAGSITTGANGFVEVSGKHSLAFTGRVDTRGGTLLLDPDNITIVAGSTSLPSGLDGDPGHFWSTAEDPGSQTLGADTLTDLLLTNSVSLAAADTLTVDAPIVVPAGGAPAIELSLQAPTLAINQSISLANVTDGWLKFFGPGNSLTTAVGATLAASRIYLGGFPITTLNGPVSATQLDYENTGSPTSFTATNPANAIANLLLATDKLDPHAVSFSGSVAVHSGSALAVRALIGGAANVTLSAVGDLTLNADGGITLPATSITASGVTKLASTGGVLINAAGPGLLAGAARQLLYTSTTKAGSGFDLGGLTGFTRVSGVSFPDDPQSALAQALYRADGLLTITADAKSKTYGDADPAFIASYSGFLLGDDATSLTAQPVFALQEATHVNAGTYTIVPSGAADDYYDFAYANGTFTINPATLTYTADAATRTTVGADPAFSGTVTGFVNGDTQATATTGTLAFTTTATPSSPAGSYALTGSGLTALTGNYIFQQAAANATAFTITQAGTLVITADSLTKLYGQPDPAFTATYTGGTAADLTTLPTFSVAEGAHVNAGTYTIVPAGAASSTFALSYQNGTLTIDPAVLTYIANAASRNTTQPDPAFSGTVTGFVNGDTQATATTGALAFTTTATPSSPAGGYALTGSGLTALNGNYIFQQAAANATAFTISPAALLTITANDFIKTYGAPDPTFTASYAGGTTADLTTLPTFSIAEGAHVNAGAYTIVPAGAASATHSLAYVNGTLRIDPAVLTYAANPATRLYGDANPAFSGSVTGFVNGDTLASATTGTLAFTSPATAASATGSYAINGGGLTANFGNYVFEDAVANFSALTVDKAPLTILVGDTTRLYGDPNPAFTAQFSGFRNGDTAAALDYFALATTAGAQSSVGTYPINALIESDNYTVTATPGTLTLSPAPLTLTVNPAAMIYGDALPAFTYTLNGLVGDDTASVLSGVQFPATLSLSNGAGAYLISPTALGTAQNYQVTNLVLGVLTVNRRPLTVAADNLTTYAGYDAPPLTTNASATPVPGGPQFTFGVGVFRGFVDAQDTFHTAPVTLSRATPAGTYILTPFIQPGAGTTVEEVERFYAVTTFNGRLTLDKAPIDPSILYLPTVTKTDSMVIRSGNFTAENVNETLIDSSSFETTLDTDTQITLTRLNEPLTPAFFSTLVGESAESMMAALKHILTKGLTPEEAERGLIRWDSALDIDHATGELTARGRLLQDLYTGRMTFEQAAARMATDSLMRQALLPVIMQSLVDDVASGRPLTPEQQILSQRMTKKINDDRARIVSDARTEYDAWQKVELSREQAGASTLFDLSLMPDIASKVQAEVMSDNLETLAAGLTIGVGAATVMGGSAVGTVLGLASSIFVLHKATGVTTAALTSAQLASWSAAGVSITVSAGVLVLSVAVTEMVISETNEANYQALVDYNSKGLDSLGSLDLNNAQQQIEFVRTFAGVFGEAFSP